MDLQAVLARKPELCLIDELAHTNAPGVEHEKRYEDVRDVLEAGIDVFSTVNVQHLESLNDQVNQLTGTRVRETIPDEVLSEADEVVLIDLTPEALIARLRAGKVYRAERVPRGAEQLLQDREPRPRCARRRCARWPRTSRSSAWYARAPLVRRDEEGLPLRRAGAAGDRRASAGARHARRRVRAGRAPRLALGPAAGRGAGRARGAPAGRPPSPEDRKRLEELRRLISMLGARLRVEEGEDVATVAIGVARALGSTYVLMGTPSQPRGLSRLGGGAERTLLMRLLRGLPGRRRAHRRRPDAARRGARTWGRLTELLQLAARMQVSRRKGLVRLFPEARNPRSAALLRVRMRRLRRPLPILLVAAATVASALATIGQAGAATRPAPRAHAAASYLTGIGDEQATMFTNPLWQQLHTKIARYIAPYDAAVRPYSLDKAKRLDPCRRSAARAGAGRLLPLRVHAHEAAERGRLPTRCGEVRQAVPPRPPVPVLGRGQPRQRAPRLLEPLGGARGRVLPGAAARVQRLHGRSGSTSSTRQNISPTLSYISEFKREIGRLQTVMPTIWGLHDYSDVNRLESWRTRELVTALGGQVWLTETGGIVQFGGAFPNSHGSGLTRAAKVLKYMFALAGSSAADQAPVHL